MRFKLKPVRSIPEFHALRTDNVLDTLFSILDYKFLIKILFLISERRINNPALPECAPHLLTTVAGDYQSPELTRGIIISSFII